MSSISTKSTVAPNTYMPGVKLYVLPLMSCCVPRMTSTPNTMTATQHRIKGSHSASPAGIMTTAITVKITSTMYSMINAIVHGPRLHGRMNTTKASSRKATIDARIDMATAIGAWKAATKPNRPPSPSMMMRAVIYRPGDLIIQCTQPHDMKQPIKYRKIETMRTGIQCLSRSASQSLTSSMKQKMATTPNTSPNSTARTAYTLAMNRLRTLGLAK